MVRRQGALESITLREEYASGLAPVEVDVPRIKQVFLNLINNAVYVMKDRGGSLTIRSSASGGDMVQVEVIDTGTGIAPDHMHRIFEPFFTTKPEVSGTGLGLSVSLGLWRATAARSKFRASSARAHRSRSSFRPSRAQRSRSRLPIFSDPACLQIR